MSSLINTFSNHPFLSKSTAPLGVNKALSSKISKELSIDLITSQIGSSKAATETFGIRNRSLHSKLQGCSNTENIFASNKSFSKNKQASFSTPLTINLYTPLSPQSSIKRPQAKEVMSPIQAKIDHLKKSFGVLNYKYNEQEQKAQKKSGSINLSIPISGEIEKTSIFPPHKKIEIIAHSDNHILNKINTLKKESFFQEITKPPKTNKFQNNPVKIFDWLILGGKRHSLDLDYLKDNQIECILNVAIECQNIFPKRFTYKKIPICDTPNTNIKMYLIDVADFLEDCRLKNKKVYVHCYMGRSRSTSCVISYMIKYKGYSYESAYLFIKNLKPDVNPNYGFVKQLKGFEDDCKKQKSLK